MMRKMASLLEEASTSASTRKKELVIESKRLAETVQKMRQNIHSLIDKIPRCDFPRLDETLKNRLTSSCDNIMMMTE